MSFIPTDIDLNFPVPIKVVLEKRPSARIALREKQIIIRIPKSMTIIQKRTSIEDLLQWARTTIEAKGLYQKHTTERFAHGDTIKLLDNPYVIEHNWVNSNRMNLHITNDQILRLTMPSSVKSLHEERRNTIAQLLKNGLSKIFLPDMQMRVRELNREHFNADLGKIALRYTTSRWGSCSSSGAISLSTKLLLTPRIVSDYVIIHEIAHRFEMNHSERFWALVHNAMPDYQTHRNWLKEHGRNLDF